MANDDFETRFLSAVDSKVQWFDSTELPKLQDDYRLHLTCTRNLIDAMVKKSIINPDPYKKDKKISNIVCPESGEFNESERAVELGIRLSDYESMIDFICNYMKFSVEQLQMDKIKKLLELNNSFNWQNLSLNSPKVNTRSLANCLNQLKNGAVPLTMSMINDSLFKTNQALEEITIGLKSLAEFQREKYKAEVRRSVMGNPTFDRAKAMTSSGAMLMEIKRVFPSGMPKKSFASELIEEIIQEELGANKTELQSKVMAKLQVEEAKSKKKEVTVDTHEMLMDSIRSLGSMSDQMDVVLSKVIENHDVLEGEHNSFMDKIKRLIRHTFGLADPVVEYDVVLTDKSTGAKRKERVNYNQFIETLAKRSKYYSSISVKHTPGYNKINSMKDDEILSFLNKQITENNKLQAILSGLDEYFKNSVQAANRPKIKGLSMELTALKNSLVKTNQQRAEYVAYVEEQNQMKKLGLING